MESVLLFFFFISLRGGIEMFGIFNIKKERRRGEEKKVFLFSFVRIIEVLVF